MSSPGGTLVPPASIGEVVSFLEQARSQGWTVRPMGAGRHLGMGAPAVGSPVLLPLGGLHRVVDYRPEDWVITVEAGISLAALQAVLQERGQTLPLDPWGGPEVTVGGAVATGLTGPLTTGYGGPRDLVLGLTVILADGRRLSTGAKVVKNVAGYDLTRMYVGSLGSLGVLVEATLRVHPLPAARNVLLAAFPSPRDAVAAARRVLRTPVRPEAVEIHREPRSPAWQVGVQVAGSPRVVDRKVHEMRRALPGAQEGLLPRPPERVAALWQVALPLDTLPVALESLADALPEAGVALRAGLGVGELYLQEIPEDLAARLAAVRAREGVEVTAVQVPRPWAHILDPYGRSPRREERFLRQALDPSRMLNPGVHLADRPQEEAHPHV